MYGSSQRHDFTHLYGVIAGGDLYDSLPLGYWYGFSLLVSTEGRERL